MFIHSTGEPVLPQVFGYSEHGNACRCISYEREGKTVLPPYCFVLQCNFCSRKCTCSVVVRFPRGWGDVTWQLSPRGWRETVFPGVGHDKAGGGGRFIGDCKGSGRAKAVPKAGRGPAQGSAQPQGVCGCALPRLLKVSCAVATSRAHKKRVFKGTGSSAPLPRTFLPNDIYFKAISWPNLPQADMPEARRINHASPECQPMHCARL